MRKTFWVFPWFVFFLQGCAALPFILVGTAGVVGGVAISEDTVQADVDAPFSKAWSVALNEIEKMGGEIQFQDKTNGLIDAKVRAAEVQIQVHPLTDKSVRLKVKSRKNYLPNIKLAHQISARIIGKL